MDAAVERPEDADDAAQQRRFAGTVRADHRNQRAGGDLAAEVMHGRVPVITKCHVVEVHGRHDHLIASQTTPQSTTQTAIAADRRAAIVMRKIDQGAAWAGCGWAASWTWAWLWSCPCECPWAWEWS